MLLDEIKILKCSGKPSNNKKVIIIILFHLVSIQPIIDMISRLTIFIIAFTILPSLIIGDPCRYESEKGIIDLTSVGRIDGTAAYVEKIPLTEHKYSISILIFVLILIKIVFYKL